MVKDQMPKDFVVKIEMGSPEMQTDKDIAEALTRVAVALIAGNRTGKVQDSKGKIIGIFGKINRPIKGVKR